MSSNFDLNSPEQKGANAAKREAEKFKKRKQRERKSNQEEIDALLALDPENAPASQQAIWARNKTKLSDDEISALEARQFAFGGLLLDVTEVIRDLPQGRKTDPANGGLPFVDTLWESCQPFVSANDGTRLVFHLYPEEFADLYRTISGQPFKHFTENIDREWFLFGYYTRFLTMETWNKFVDVVAAYIQSNPDESHLAEDFRLDKETCDRILAEWQRRQPRHRPETTHHNLRESEQREEYDRISAVRLEKEIADAQKHIFPSFEF